MSVFCSKPSSGSISLREEATFFVYSGLHVCAHTETQGPHLLPHISTQPLLTLPASLLDLEHAFPSSSFGKESTCNVGSLGWEDPWRRERLPTPVFWLGEFHGL